VYGPVRTVVWEGWSRKAPPYPDLWPSTDVKVRPFDVRFSGDERSRAYWGLLVLGVPFSFSAEIAKVLIWRGFLAFLERQKKCWTTGPHDFAVRELPCIRLRKHRVYRISPRVRDVAQRPSHRVRWAKLNQ